MRIVLLGSGFIGYHLCKLLHKSADVVVVNRTGVPSNQQFPGVTYIQGNCNDESFLKHTIRKNDTILFLAYNSVPKTSFEEPLKDISENLPLAVNIFNVAKDMQIRKLIYLSSGGTIYGKTPEYTPICEKHATNPISPYGITKLSIEKYAQFYASIYNLPVIIARPSNPFGEFQLPFRGQGFIATAIAALLKKQSITIFGEYGTIRDYIYIDDLTQALITLAEAEVPIGEVYNIGSGHGYSNIDVLNELKPHIVKAGLELQTVFQPERGFDVPYNVLSPTKIQNLGWKPIVSFAEGIEKTFQWLQKQQF